MRPLTIEIVTPAPRGSRHGNRVTAVRWGSLLRSSGHRVRIRERWQGAPVDVLVALHARRSFESVAAFAREHPDRPLILALTGTDLYSDLAQDDESATLAIRLATRLVVLQPLAIERLPEACRAKARTIHQSVRGIPSPDPSLVGEAGAFPVVVIGHLRPVKDPFRAALAARALPSSSRIEIRHCGSAHTQDMAKAARREESGNPRYRWLGELTHLDTLRQLVSSRLLVHSSVMEGGANVIGEAIVAGIPILASRIDGSRGLLGESYEGWFPVEDTATLTRLLHRAETDADFLARLHAQVAERRPLFLPEREQRLWDELLGEFNLG